MCKSVNIFVFRSYTNVVQGALSEKLLGNQQNLRCKYFWPQIVVYNLSLKPAWGQFHRAA